MTMKVFEFLINPEDETMGMQAISIVDKPAIESEFIAFNKQEKPKFIRFVDDKKYIVAGLALIPDKLIYRVDESGEDYLGYFSAETIEIIMDKFMKESTMGTLKDVNLQHDSERPVQAHLVESFILRTDEMVNAVKAMGISEAVKGAWFVSYKFDNVSDYEKAVNGEFTGFSVEIMLQRELKMNKNNNKINNVNAMTKLKTFVDKFKTLLDEIQNSGVFEDVVVPDSGKSLRIGEVGTPVTWISTDETGNEIEEPALEGEYILEDGRVVVVDASGNLAEIKDANIPIQPIPEEDMEAVSGSTEQVLSGDTAQVVAPTGDTAQVVDISSKTLGEIVDISKDGEYEIKVVVSGGAITEATAEASQNLIGETLAATENELTTANQTIVDLNAEIERLKTELAKPVTKSALTEFTEYREKSDFKPKTNLEAVQHRLGLL